MPQPPLLNEAAIREQLETLTLWRREEKEIVAQLAFPSFMRVIEFVNAVAEAAEAAHHHPDIDIRYRNAILRLSTHDSGGLTQQDFDLARQIEALFATYR